MEAARAFKNLSSGDRAAKFAVFQLKPRGLTSTDGKVTRVAVLKTHCEPELLPRRFASSMPR